MIVLAFDLLFWLMAFASGHHIPSQTNLSFGVSSLILLVLIALVVYMEQRFKNKGYYFSSIPIPFANSKSESHAVKSIIGALICCAISLVLIVVKFDRLTTGLGNWLLFIPMFYYSFYQSVIALVSRVKNKDQFRFVFYFMTISIIVIQTLWTARIFYH